jgi:hypothetical protein
MDSKICKPALIYLVIALIMLCVGIIMRLDTFNLSGTCSQLSSIILCTLILMGLCSVAPQISWAITIIFILCTVSALVSIIMNWINPPMTS